MKPAVALVTAAAMVVSFSAAAQDAAGEWHGVLEVAPGQSLPLVVRIRRDDAGAVSGTLDSPAQGAMGLPLANIVANAARLAFEVPVVAGEFEAAWDSAAKAWKGQWRQGGASWPLSLAEPPPPPPLPADWRIPDDRAIIEALAARIASRSGQGIVIGIVEPDGPRIVAVGPAGSTAFAGDTVFEIGSISKVFTALLLADMTLKGEVKLDDPAAKYLPAGSRMPERGGRQITLADLATHGSGLPRLADNMPASDPDDPYADYSEAHLLEFLGKHELTRDIGARSEYSNLGAGLLGYLLGRAAGADYETLLRERITGPLGLRDTVVTLTPEQQARFGQGHDPYLRPAKPWRLPVLAGAGAIRSTAADLARFVTAALDPASPIAPAMKLTLSRRMPTEQPRTQQALGWQVIDHRSGRELVAHGGGTGGFRAQLLLDPARRIGVIALTNAAAEPSVTDLAFHILAGVPVAPTPPLPPAPVARTEVRLPESELDRVVGRYAMAPGVELAISRRGPGVAAQLTGQGAAPIFAEAPLRFFWRVVDAQLRFSTDAKGNVTGVELDQDGRTLRGKRVGP